jgi:hypothetical protein
VAATFAALATLANYSQILFQIALAGGLAALCILQATQRGSSRGLLRSLTAIVVLTGIPLAFALSALHRIAKARDLEVGGTAGFFADTIGTLAKVSVSDHASLVVSAQVLAGLLLVLGPPVALLSARGSGLLGVRATALFFSSLLSLSAIGAAASHYLLDTKLPIERHALWLVPLAVLAACHLVSVLKHLRLALVAKDGDLCRGCVGDRPSDGHPEASIYNWVGFRRS